MNQLQCDMPKGLHAALFAAEEAEETNPKVLEQLSRSLFKQRIETLPNGVKRQCVASSAETLSCIRDLIQRRKNFMNLQRLADPGIASQPSGTRGSASQPAGA